MTDKEKILLCELFEKQIDASLTQEEATTLEKIVLNNPEAQNFYFDLTVQNAGLEDQKLLLADENFESTVKSSKSFYKLALAACLLLGSVLGFLMNQTPAPQAYLAILEKVEHCQWLEGSLPTAKGSQLKAGFLQLQEGIAHLRFNSGVKLQLEAPAHIELIDDMHCIIHYGTALADVPEAGKGFRIDTPTVMIIDHGTRFVVRHRPTARNASFVEVLEGEIEVKGQQMKQSIRYGKGKRIFASASKLMQIQDEEEIDWSLYAQSPPPEYSKTIKLTTADGKGSDCTVTRTSSSEKEYNIINYDPSLLMMKNSDCSYARKAYLKFDLSNISKEKLRSVSLNLTMVFTGIGIASYVDDSSFDLYVVKDESLDNWQAETIKWLDAPAALEDAGAVDTAVTSLIGSFTLPQGIYAQTISLESDILKKAILADTNNILTVIAVRRTKENENGGLVHAFAGAKHSTLPAPTLKFSY